MNQKFCMLSWLCAFAFPAMGQVTNVLMVETNTIRLEWAAMPGNPYRVYAAPDLVEPVWSNLTPAGLVFQDAQGSQNLPTDAGRGFYGVMASDYVIVDVSEGSTAISYPVTYTNAPPDGGWTDEYKTTKLVLRRIPAGTFAMGSPTNELGRHDDEPQHEVTLSSDYYIGVFEVTQKQWERVMGNWPSCFANAAYRESRPVENVSYSDIRGIVAGTNWPTDGNVDTYSFMGRLRDKTGHSFDLPTEAQWEYACRSGTTTALNCGKDLTTSSNCPNMDAAGRYYFNGGSGFTPNGDTSVATAKAGTYQPSAWGLYPRFCV
jgi:formylglycine-generating enzyme required for sulfatase activity